MTLTYTCVNERCDSEGDIFEVAPGETADCPDCGWSLVVVDGRNLDSVG